MTLRAQTIEGARRDALLRKIVAEAKLWRDAKLAKPARRRARRRFERALDRLGLNPVDRIYQHMTAVAMADHLLVLREVADAAAPREALRES